VSSPNAAAAGPAAEPTGPESLEASLETPLSPDLTKADRLVRVGSIIFLIGLVTVLIVVVPFFFGVDDAPEALNAIAAVCLPLGFGLALYGLWRTARAERIPPE
jgi:hypothetical protein